MAYDKKTKEYIGWIYCIENTSNETKYIGQTMDSVQKRFNRHLSSARNGEVYALYCAMRKYGTDKFIVSEIECVKSKNKECLSKLLDQREIYWIDFYNTYYGIGYNETLGGSFGSSLCEEKYLPVDVYRLNGEKILECKSVTEAHDLTGADNSAIIRCCKGQSKTAKGLTFRYQGDSFDKFSVRDSRNYYVYQFSINQKLLKTYNSLTEANKLTGFDYRSLSAAIQYKRPYMGFYWNDKNEFPIREDVYDNRVKIDKYSLLGDLLGTYDSMSDGAKSIGKGYDVVSTISDCCYGQKQYAFNYIWRIYGDPFDKYDTNIVNSNCHPVNCYNLQNEFIGSFQTLPLAQNELNLDKPIANACLKSKTHISHNHKFYYIEDSDQPDESKIKTLNEFLHEKYVLPILNKNPTN